MIKNIYEVEKSFLKLKYWRGIATRYAQTTYLIKRQSKFIVCLCDLISYDNTTYAVIRHGEIALDIH